MSTRSRPALVFTLLSAAFILLSWPASQVLPVSVGWENNWLENTQLLVLAVGFVMAIRYASAAHSEPVARFWLMVVPFWLIFMGRETSWGAVLTTPLQVHPTEGPVFSSSVLWYKPVVYPVLGVLLLISAFLFLRSRADRLLRGLARRGDFPVLQLALMVVGALVMTNAEGHGWIEITMAKGAVQVLEETAELGAYFALLAAQFRIAAGLARGD